MAHGIVAWPDDATPRLPLRSVRAPAAACSAEWPHPEVAPLDPPGAQALECLVRQRAGDRDVGAGGVDVDLADVVGLEAGLAGQRAQDVARSEERRVGKEWRARWGT